MLKRPKTPPLLIRLWRTVAGFFAAMGAAWRRTTGRIERTVGSAAARAVDTAQQANKFDVFIRRMGRLLLWPFRALARAAQAIVPGPVRRMFGQIGRSFQRGLQGLSNAAVALAQKLNLDRAALAVVRFTRPLWLPIVAVGNFFVLWAQTRDYKKLLWGIPALVMLLPFAYVGGKVAISGNRGIVGRYQRAVNTAFEEADFQAAALYQRKLQQLGADTSLADFRAAEKLFDDGRVDEALTKMTSIAQGQGRGALSSAYWIVQQILNKRIQLPEDERLEVVGKQLDRLEELAGSRSPEIQTMRALWLIQKQDLPAAADLLKELVADQPGVAFERMVVNIQLERLSEARGDALLVRRHYADQQRRSVNLTSMDYARWSGAEELLGDTARLKDVLDIWTAQFPDDPQLQNALAGSYLRQLQYQLRRPNKDPVALSDAIIGTVLHSPENVAVMEAILNELVQQRQQSDVAASIVAELTGREELPGILWRYLGTAACLQEDFADARQWLIKAIDRDGNDPVAKNNYAWLLANVEPVDLDNALRLVNEALALMPDEFRFRETRGQILVQLERWDDAIVDLEFALNGMPKSVEIQKSLAVAYRATGQPELAALHWQED